MLHGYGLLHVALTKVEVIPTISNLKIPSETAQKLAMKFTLFVLSLAVLATAEPEEKPSGLKVDYISKPDTCDKQVNCQLTISDRIR